MQKNLKIRRLATRDRFSLSRVLLSARIICIIFFMTMVLLLSCGRGYNNHTISEFHEQILADYISDIYPQYKQIEFSIFKNGDLIFQNDSSAFSDAIKNSTNANFSHVAIIDRVADTLYVIEAIADKGVSRSLLTTFLEKTPKDSSGRPMIKIMRLSKIPHATLEIDSLQFIVDQAVKNAKKFIGKEYDFAFESGTEKLYCSELVYESFRYHNEPIFSTVAMNFTDSSGAISNYWIEYYEKLGRPVPQGEPGTNPGDLSKSPLLREIAF